MNTRETQSEVRSSELVRCAGVSNELSVNLSIMKRLLGDKWETSSKEYRTILLAVMAANGETNPLAIATPMAKEMSERGHNPLMLLAVATDMASTPNSLIRRKPVSPEREIDVDACQAAGF